MSLFITFEGPDGAGKSTQTELVARLLRDEGHRVLVTREPGGTPLGERIRSVLLQPDECAIVPRAEALLMTAARAQHVADVIRPAIDDGVFVLCDRFVDSTLAYQGAGRGLPIEDLRELQHLAFGDCRPAVTFLLDLTADSGLLRRVNSGTPLNRLDQDDIAFHTRVRDWYVQAAAHEPERWVVLDAERPKDELAREIAREILERRVTAGEAARPDGKRA